MRIKSFKSFGNKFLLVNFRSPKTPILKTVLESLGFNIEMTDWDEIESNNTSGITGIILSGSPTNLSMEDAAPYIEKFSFIKNTNVPVLGICFGHQVIGMIFDGKIYRGPTISKNETIKLVVADPLLEGFINNEVIMDENHAEGVSLPIEFECLGKSESCDNEIMKHKSKNIYGVQFHPETSGEPGKTLLQNFYNICM